jgi:methylmalonyl-CoA mutase C-terminal domain/subunit
LFPQVVTELASRQSADIVVFGGGVIPDADIAGLVEAGLATVFTPGTPLDEITEWVDAHVPSRSESERGNP